MTPDMRQALHDVGTEVVFSAGDVLREKGTFAPDMLLITQGHVDCFVSDDEAERLTVGPGTIVGEIGFLTGQGATATLRAQGEVHALSIDAEALQRLRRNTPEIAATVLRHLAELLSDRSAQNEGLAQQAPEGGVIRCSTLDLKRTAQRVRYDVACLERGEQCATADPEEGIITDDLDRTGTSFLAFDGVQAIGMMRLNFTAQGDAEITAFAVRDAYRSDTLFRMFFSALSTFARASDATNLIATCRPEDAPIFAAHGFQRTGSSGDLTLTLGPPV